MSLLKGEKPLSFTMFLLLYEHCTSISSSLSFYLSVLTVDMGEGQSICTACHEYRLAPGPVLPTSLHVESSQASSLPRRYFTHVSRSIGMLLIWACLSCCKRITFDSLAVRAIPPRCCNVCHDETGTRISSILPAT